MLKYAENCVSVHFDLDSKINLSLSKLYKHNNSFVKCNCSISKEFGRLFHNYCTFFKCLNHMILDMSVRPLSLKGRAYNWLFRGHWAHLCKTNGYLSLASVSGLVVIYLRRKWLLLVTYPGKLFKRIDLNTFDRKSVKIGAQKIQKNKHTYSLSILLVWRTI
jgi:hypothetical protein